jgi:large subunit ribosomal protein L21
VIDVDRLPADVGATVELNDVLLVAGNGDVQVGQPLVAGARVVAEVVEQGRDPKILVFKYKAKTRYRRRRGHRQGYTRLAVRHILTAEEEKPKRRRAARPKVEAEAEAPKPARKPRARKAAVEPEAKVEAAAPEAATAAPEAAAKPARRTRRPKAEAAGETGEAKPARKPRARKPKAEAEATPDSESSGSE